MHWRAPIVARTVENNQGPVVVVVEYRVDANDRAEFLSAVDGLGYARKRDGAYAWGVYEDVADSGRFIETFSIESWLEVLHQRERATNADEMLRSRFASCSKRRREPVSAGAFFYYRHQSDGCFRTFATCAPVTGGAELPQFARTKVASLATSASS